MIGRLAILRAKERSVPVQGSEVGDVEVVRRSAAPTIWRLAAVGFALAALLALPAAVSADPGDLGFEGPSGAGAGAAPTGSKPQAKLWFNDDIWWASMWDVGTSDFYIWKLDRQTETWSRTNTRLDDRASTRADILWDGTKLYVASHNFSDSDGSGQARLYRYSYSSGTDTYTLDTGFPAVINNVQSETLVIDKDSSGKLWATWEQGTQIWVNRTNGIDNQWNATPFVLPGSQNVSTDDISSLIAFGGNKLGVYYSNQSGSPDNDSFIVHTDGQPDTTWGPRETAFAGNNFADDHVNLKTDPANGNVYAVVKTSLTGSSQLIKFLKRDSSGNWTNYDVATGTDSHTRPILLLDFQHSLFRIYMTHGQAGGPIVEKTSPMGAISWPTGVGTPVLWDASANDMNNSTSTKQNITAQSGLIVAAFEDTTKHYWHADIFGGGGQDTTPPTVTTKVPTDQATGVAIGANVSATFDEAVTGVSGTTFTLTGPGNTQVSATVSYDGPTRTATLDPTANLATNTQYTATLTNGITDLSNNALVQVQWTFTTAAPDVTPPTVTNVTPPDTSTGVAIATNVSATFSEDVTGVNGSTFTLTGPGNTSIPAAVTYDGPTKTATLDPSANLATNTSYTATLTSGITDLSSNALSPVTWTFTTGAAPAGAVFKSASSGNNATATTLVLPAPAGTASGDALLATVAARGSPTITPPAGWSLVRLDASGSTVRQAVYVHIAGGSEPANYTFTLSSAQSAAGGILDYTGVDPTTPIDTSLGQANVASTSILAPSITTSGPSRMLVGLFATAALTSETAPGGMVERFDVAVPSTNQYKVTTAADDQLLVSAGATGTRTALAATSGINIGQLVALNPGGGPPPDNTPPTVTNTTPADQATNVSVGTNVTATFSEDVTGVSGSTFTLTGPGNSSVPASVSYNSGTKTATLDPTSNLAASTSYTATLTSGITDLSNNALVQVTWSFTTAAGPPPAGIAFRAASSGNNTTATSLVIPAPSGVISGDVLLAVVSARGGPTITAPAGWTLVRSDISGSTIRQLVFVKTAGGSEPGSYTFTLSTAQSAAGGIVAYSGVDGANPIDAHGGQANASSTSISAPSITTTGPDRMLVGFFGTAALTTETAATGMTERFDQTVPSTNQFKVTAGADDAVVSAAGATGGRAAVAANSGVNIGQLVALRPAP